MSNPVNDFDVLIVGAGVSGMSAYLEAKRHSGVRVGLVEHEAAAGGELRFYRGFDEANEVRESFLAASEDDLHVQYQTTVLGVLPAFRKGDPLEVSISGPKGASTVTTQKLLLCTGMFDRSRENNRVPGQRPAGVITPSFAVRVLEHGVLPGRNLVVHVESRRDVEAAQQLKAAGANVTAVIGSKESLERFQDQLAHLKAELVAYEKLVRIEGSARVEAVTVAAPGRFRRIVCDTVVYASGKHANLFALKGSEIELNHQTGGILVNEFGETSLSGIYAVGTCVDLHEDHAHSLQSGRRVMEHIVQTLSPINS